MSIELTRRAVLFGGAVAAASGLAWLGCDGGSARSRRGVLALAEEVQLGAGAAALGRAYLDLHADEANAERLLELLFPGRGDLGPSSMRSLLAERIGRDWVELETAQVDGWIVSRSEGRFLALVALLSDRVPPER